MKKVFVLLFFIVAGFAYLRFSHSAGPRYIFRTVPLESGNITSTVTATGKLGAVTVVEVGTQVSGTLKEIYADFNQHVKKGELIALIDPDVLRAKLEEVKANLAMARASVARAQANVADSDRNLKRNRELWNRQLIARSELDAAETTHLANRASLQEAQARVLQVQASLRQAETNLDYTRILSPEDGVVISREVNVGQTVAASLSAPTLFTIAKDLSDMQIETSVDEADIARVKEGQEVEFTVDAYGGTTFTGKVRQVRISPATSDNVVTYPVIISVANPDLKLKPGMTANVSIVTDRRKDVLKVPMAALRFSPPPEDAAQQTTAAPSSPFSPSMPRRRPGGAGGGAGLGNGNTGRTGTVSVVWTVSGDVLGDRVQFRAGISDGSFVEVIDSRELKEGDLLAVSYSEQPKESLWGKIFK
ncbi:efflux RND transporter periplasmic adaptor subunit [Aminivibrio sp.]|uniref:efflux RND transporter periplasmic adaptor subunit n=1 Tax=Aminivibrio sp. TaxID=1872489 RepID=UPI001A613258|nr:efflux RND transporter periplasmic adaptor subunit [Aminivibrio sp.]MBL3538137.1 efflux RND transporter periplasmic adaptor subunit [Aminivibrio sp.]